MDTLLQQNEKPKGINKGYVIGGVIGVILIGALIGLVLLRPSMEDQMTAILEGSFREGAPELALITKDIIISTDDKTVESPNAFGSISMYIVGRVKNRGTRVINGLEVNVAVIDQFNQVVKEKRVLVVPTQQALLEPGDVIPITLSLDGFKKNDDRANIRWKVTAIRVAN
ncbi:MAG: hypothetical protein ACT4O9_04875 [Blastocatellia bacterium]